MREIKFRAFYKPTKKMFWFDVMDGNHNVGTGYIGMTPFGETQDAHGSHRGNMKLVDPNDCEIMQFTELLDRHGKEIYEGDIVSHWAKPEGYPLSQKMEYREVIMNNGYNKWTFLWSHYQYEVIGNIHQNHELLK